MGITMRARDSPCDITEWSTAERDAHTHLRLCRMGMRNGTKTVHRRPTRHLSHRLLRRLWYRLLNRLRVMLEVGKAMAAIAIRRPSLALSSVSLFCWRSASQC